MHPHLVQGGVGDKQLMVIGIQPRQSKIFHRRTGSPGKRHRGFDYQTIA
jgi:hypothetical protein